MLTEIAEIKKTINATQKMVWRDVLLKVKGVKQMPLITALLAHHRNPLRLLMCVMLPFAPMQFVGVFQHNYPQAAGETKDSGSGFHRRDASCDM